MLPGIGVFGTGRIVQILVPCLRSRGFCVEAIWGHDLESVKQFAKDLEIPFFTDKEDEVLLRRSVSLVCILCEPHMHAQIAVKALGIGKHVLCDKPVGLSEADVVKMVAAAQYYPSLISIISHGLRFLPAVSQMRRSVVQEQYTGEIRVCDVRVYCSDLLDNDSYGWSSDTNMGGGVLANIGSQMIDLITFVTDMRAVRVAGTVRNFWHRNNTIHRVTSDDFCSVQMELENGAIATLTISSHFPGQYIQEVVVSGDKANIILRGGDLYGQKYGCLKEEVIYLDVEDLKQSPLPQNVDDIKRFRTPPLPKPHIKGLIKMTGALRDTFVGIHNGQIWRKEHVASAASFEDGLYVQRVVEAVRKASECKTWIRVTPPGDGGKNKGGESVLFGD